jgi:hypothetical protein
MAAKLRIKKAVQKAMSSIPRFGMQSTEKYHSLEHSMIELPVHNRVPTFQQADEADGERMDSKRSVCLGRKHDFLFRITPQRLLEKMKGNDEHPACGWGVALELGFGLPFYLEFLALFATSCLIFGILAWCLIQLKSKGYAVFGVWGGLIGSLGFCFAIVKVYVG